MRARVLPFLLVLAATLGPVAEAKRSDACPGGCIIAQVVYPKRQCACVVPQCNDGGDSSKLQRAAASATAAKSKPGRRRDKRPPQLQGVDCHFCERDAFSYISFEECYAADASFKPAGPSIDSRVYPSLVPPGRSDTVSPLATIGPAQVACPPAAAAGCQDLSSITTWESLLGSASSDTDVVIPPGATVVLHGCTQPSNTVSVNTITIPAGSRLIIGDSPLKLNLKHMTVNGAFQMGTSTCPITSEIAVTIPGGDEANGIDVNKGGTYDVHGLMQGLTWTRIAATVLAGSNTITLQEKVQWKAGDQILLVTTTWKDEIINQNEVLTILNIAADGMSLTTKKAVQFNHYGVEYKAEVALLTRKILFTSDDTSTSTKLGPHTTMLSPDCRITGAAFERWGARNRPGRYPIHFHLARDAGSAYIKNNAIYNSNWRCVTIHGTNEVYVYGNVGFNVHGHCYYLEDGVEERNVLERNLAAYVHPIQTAGSAGGQQGTDRWQSEALFDPSDSGAAGFYSLNAYNIWKDNAAVGGFSGFTFPHAPRAIKDHKNIKKPNGFPFDPSERPLLGFTGNTVHSTGYFWEHNGCIYFGGMLFYKKDDSDGQVKLFYNNGRGSVYADQLCPDPDWPADDGDNSRDCWVGASRRTRNADDTGDGFLVVEDSMGALCNVGVMSWGDRIEVKGFRGYDVTRGAEFLGESWLTKSLFKVNTQNSANGWSGWPYAGDENWWESYAIKGFEWYDTTTSSLLSDVTFEGYKYRTYVDDPNDWWYHQTPSVFRMLSHSNQFKPDKTMMVTKGIKCNNVDMPTCQGGVCTKNAFFRVDKTYRGASWLFNWLDLDGSVVRQIAPSKPAGPYLIASFPDWWKLDASSWLEPRFGGVWVSPMPANEVAARVEMRVENDGQRYTVGSFDGEDITRIGYVSQFGDVSRQVVMTKTEGTTGMTGKYGWYTVWNTTTAEYQAPKRLELILFNVPRTKWVYWASCWPAGTSFGVAKKFDDADCLNISPMAAAATREALLAGGGDTYWVSTSADGSRCLHLKLTDPGQPWQYTNSFERDGMYIELEVRWYSLRYIITASGPGMSCSDTHFCPLPGDPAPRVPPAITSQPASCQDVQPAGDTCGEVKCGWVEPWDGCTNTDIKNGGLCQASCGTCRSTPTPSKVMVVFVNMRRALVDRKWVCTVTIEVKDTNGRYLPGGASITGQWSRDPDSPSDAWPFPGSGKSLLRTSGKVQAVIRSLRSLPIASGHSCIFTVTGVSGGAAAGYTIDWDKSTARAASSW